MSNYEIVYDNQKTRKSSGIDTDFSFSDSAFYQSAQSAFELRLMPELIAKELSFFAICFAIFMFVGNDGSLTENKVFNYYVLYVPVFIAGYQLLRASFVSMLPGLICISMALFMKYLGVHIENLNFIDPKGIGYLLGVGFLILPLSFFRSF